MILEFYPLITNKTTLKKKSIIIYKHYLLQIIYFLEYSDIHNSDTDLDIKYQYPKFQIFSFKHP